MKVANTYHLGVPSRERNSALLAVCVQDDNGMYAVYIGLVQLPDVSDEERYAAERERAGRWVALNGTKQRYDEARRYFPSLLKERYRA